MDRLTQKFLEHLVKDVTGKLDGIQQSLADILQKYQDAITKDHNASQKKTTVTPELRAVLNFPEGIQADKKTAREREQEYHRKTLEHYDDTAKYQNRNILLAVVTFLTLVLYTFATLWIVRLNRETIDSTQKNFNVANRPFVGVELVVAAHVFKDKSGKTIALERQTKNTSELQFTVEVKNFGPLPGTDVTNDWHIWLGDQEVTQTRIPDSPFTLFPGQVFLLHGTIGSPDYPLVMSGQKTLRVEVITQHQGPGGPYTQCDWQQFFPATGSHFIRLGSGCEKQEQQKAQH